VVTQLLNDDKTSDSPPIRVAAVGNAFASDELLYNPEKGRTTTRYKVGADRVRCWILEGPKIMRLLGLDDEPMPEVTRVDQQAKKW
jgi:hypothetical protein